MAYRAVIFDIGGVLFPSPFEAWASYEKELGLEVGFIRRVIAAAGSNSAWARLERGEITRDEFIQEFELECRAAGGAPDPAEVIARVAPGSASPRREMIEAIGSIRAQQISTAALTNNFARDTTTSSGGGREFMSALFDVVVESSVLGMRKPDPRIYLHTCDLLKVTPQESVFLDDLGMNLKPARQLGITTIKVSEPLAAIAELESVLGFPLRSG